MNQIYFFSNDDFPHLEVVDETLKTVSIASSSSISPLLTVAGSG